MRRLSAVSLLVIGLFVAAYADVLVCTSPTSCAAKSSPVGSDSVLFCPDRIDNGTPQLNALGKPTCATAYPIPYSNAQSWSPILTDSGWYQRASVPTGTSTAFSASKPFCWFTPIGSGTMPKFDTLSPRGGNVATEPALITWGCSDGYVYLHVTYSGVFSKSAGEFASAYAKAAFLRDTSALDALSLKVTRPLTDAEKEFAAILFQESNPPPLWIVAKSSTPTRPAYRFDATAIGSKVGTVSVLGNDGKPQACDCALRYQTSTSTYCGVGGLDNVGTTAKLPSNAVSICAKP
jgi:hypothetical protein